MGRIDKAVHETQQLKGKVEEKVGKAVGNDDLKKKGKKDHLESDLKQVRESVKEAAKSAKDAIKKSR